MSESPTVVALLPAHNAEEFIERTLDSLAAQTYDDLEVLIADDASTDSTVELCERRVAADHRFRLVRRPSRLGWVRNTNELIDAVAGDLAFFMAHDDVIADDYVERLVVLLEQNPEAVLAFSDVCVTRGDGEVILRSFDDLDGVTEPFDRAMRLARFRGQQGLPYRGLMRVPAMKALRGLRRHCGGESGSDWDWLLRLSQQGWFVREPDALYSKTVRTGSVSDWNFVWPRRACLAILMAGSILRMRLSRRQRARLVLRLAAGFARRLVRRPFARVRGWMRRLRRRWRKVLRRTRRRFTRGSRPPR